MARRKKATPPAPRAIKIFWGLAIAVAVVLGPLLLMRADWMWGDGPSMADPVAPEVTVGGEAAQIRLKIDLLQGKPWVLHAVAGHASRADAIVACLTPDRGWEPMKAADGWSVHGRELVREGATTEWFFVIHTEDTVEDFLQFAAGRESRMVSVEGRKVAFGAGGRSHLVALFADVSAPDVNATPSPIPTPSPRTQARAAFVLGAEGWSHAIEAAGAFPLAVDDGSNCAWLERAEAWLTGG